MFDLLELFLEVWKIKVQKIVWEFDEITEKGVIKKAKSVFKTCKTLSKQCKLKDEMIDFPRNELKYHPEVMQEIIPKFKELNKHELGKISVALTAIYEFMNIMITYFDLDFKLEPQRKILKEKKEQLDEILIELNELNSK